MSPSRQSPLTQILIRLITRTVFFTIFGFQIARLSDHYLEHAFSPYLISVITLWFAFLSWFINRPCPRWHRASLYVAQGAFLFMAQACLIFFPEQETLMLLAVLFSFLGINIGLLAPWLSHNQPCADPLTNLFSTLTPFFGLLIGHTIALQSQTHAPIALMLWPILVSIVQYRRLSFIEQPVTDIPSKHHLYWLNVGWFWLSVVGYLLANTLTDPLFYSACFLLGFILAASLTDWENPQSWRSNSAGYWLLIQGFIFCFHQPGPGDDSLAHGGFVVLFGALSCKLLIPSISRLYQGRASHVVVGNLAWLFFAFSIYAAALEHRFLTSVALVTLLIVNGFITDTKSNFLASTFSVLQFILHRIGVRYVGTEHLVYGPQQRVLMVSNHSCFLDVPMIATKFDETLTYPIYPFWLDVWVIRVIGGMLATMYPMKPGQSSSLANVIHAIRRGHKCLIFPEGRLTDTGNLMKIFEGSVILAEHAKADVQPVIINGGMNLVSSRDDQRHVKRFFAPVRVAFGPCTPLPDSPLRGKAKRKFIKREIYRRLTETYMNSFAEMTLCEALADATRKFGKHRLAIRDHDFLNDMSYHALMQKAKLYAIRLKKQVQAKQILAISMNHGADSAALYFACFMLEIIALPVDRYISSGSFEKLCHQVKIDAIIVDAQIWTDPSHGAYYDLIQGQSITLIEFSSLNQPASYMDQLSVALQPIKLSQTSPQAIPAVLWFDETESTTTLLSQQNLCHQALQLHICCDLQGSDVVFNALPLNSCYSMLMGLLHPLLSGVRLILTTAEFSEKMTIEAFYDTQASVLVADSSLMTTVTPSADDAFETLRMRAIFTNALVDAETRSQWEQFCKSYIFSTWVDPSHAGILSINTPCYHDATSLGQLLPLTKPHHDSDGGVIALSGPVCPDFVYERSPITYRQQTAASWPLAQAVEINALGFLQIPVMPESDNTTPKKIPSQPASETGSAI